MNIPNDMLSMKSFDRIFAFIKGVFDNDAISTVRLRLFRDIRAIDRIQKALSENGANSGVKIPQKGKMDFCIAINNLKASAMLTVWDDD